MSAAIEHTVQIRLVTRERVERPLPAVLCYDPEDPFAVRVVFPTEASLDGAEVTWAFARELLATGLCAPSGEGEVQLWPCGPAHIMLELRAPEGLALVELESGAVRRFLRAAYRAVPPGRERAAEELDRGLTELLRGV